MGKGSFGVFDSEEGYGAGLGTRPAAVSMVTGTSVVCGPSQGGDVRALRETEQEDAGLNGAEFNTNKGDKIKELEAIDNEHNTVKDNSLDQ